MQRRKFKLVANLTNISISARFKLLLLVACILFLYLFWGLDPSRSNQRRRRPTATAPAGSPQVQVEVDGYLMVSKPIEPGRRPLPTVEHDADFRLVVIYSFHFTRPYNVEQYKNFAFFIRHGLYVNDSSVDYIFLFASDDLPGDVGSSEAKQLIEFSRHSNNIRIQWMSNEGRYDLCNYARLFSRGWFEAQRRARKYSHYSFINSSVRGPFVPLYADRAAPWWLPFLRQLRRSEDTSLVGAYMSCAGRPHIQTMMTFMDRRAQEIAAQLWRCSSVELAGNSTAQGEFVLKNEIVRRIRSRGSVGRHSVTLTMSSLFLV